MDFHTARPFAWPRGFTLTEILIILVIVGLLAVFGLPAVFRYSLQGNIEIARTLLKRIAVEEATWLGRHQRYGNLGELGYPAGTSSAAIYLSKDGTISGSASADAVYRVSLKLTPLSAGASDQAYFLITAQPLNRQTRDSDCATLSLASTGQVGASGTLGEADCWNR